MKWHGQTTAAARRLPAGHRPATQATAGCACGGFSLVEVMVASIIFVLFCLFFLNAAIGAMRSQQFACNYYQALGIARNRVQRARTFEYASLPLLNENQTPVDSLGNLDAYGQFQRTTVVTPYTNGVPNLYQVNVQVSYPGAHWRAAAQPVTISTLATEKW